MSELALKLIAENKAKHARGEDATYLDLGNCGLTHLPRELGECVWLETLILSNKWEEYDIEKKKYEEKVSQNQGESNLLTSIEGLQALRLLKKLVFTSRDEQIRLADFRPIYELQQGTQRYVFPTQVIDLSSLVWLQQLQQICFSRTNVSDLSPLSSMQQLRILNCSQTNVTDLSPLASLQQLQQINCSRTNVSDLSPLSSLQQLQIINCSDILVGDLSPLAALNRLQALYCFNTLVNDLSPLAALNRLQTLNCSNTKISDLSPLAGLTQLQTLDCDSTQVSNLSPLSALTQLQRLECDSTQVSDLSPLTGLAQLQVFDCSYTQVSDLSPLAGLTQFQVLRCHDTQVSDLSPLAGMIHLQILLCFSTGVSDLSPLSALMELRALNCHSTPVSDLSPLTGLTQLDTLNCHSTQVSDWSPLSTLTQLRRLFCSSTQVGDLSSLSTLIQLQGLDCSNSQLRDLSPLSTLVQLQMFSCSSTKVSNLSSLADLTQLQELSCSDTQVSDLSPLSGLLQLRLLSCADTQVCDLLPILPLIKKGVPVKWSKHEIGIMVENCPLTNPPREIVEQGNEAILNYFAERSKQQFKNTQIKLILLGNATAGKTTLSRYLREQTYDPTQATTHGIQNHRWQSSGGREMEISIWDFGGQEYYHATHRLFLSHNAVYALVWDAKTDKGGIEPAEVHYENDPQAYTVSLEHFSKVWWLKNIHFNLNKYARHEREGDAPIPVLLVQNKCVAGEGYEIQDVPNELGNAPFHLPSKWRSNHIDLAAVAKEQANGKQGEWTMRFKLFEHELLKTLENQMTTYEFAVYHRDIRDRVRALASGENPVNEMSWTEFEAMCRDIEPDAKMDLVQIYLRDITGDILYFDQNERLRHRVFLRPDWVCNRIYAILSRKVLEGEGLFDLDWVHEALYCEESEALDFVELMCEFQLVFEENNENGEPTGNFVAPQYLPDACTNAGELGGAKKYANLAHAFTLWFPEFLPKSHIARFVAHWGSKAKQRLFWKNGLLFQTDGCTALVERIAEDKIRVDIQSEGKNREMAMRRIFQSFLDLEDGQASFAVGLSGHSVGGGAAPPPKRVFLFWWQGRVFGGALWAICGGGAPPHPDTTLDYVLWSNVEAAIQADAKKVKVLSPTNGSEFVYLQPFLVFTQIQEESMKDKIRKLLQEAKTKEALEFLVSIMPDARTLLTTFNEAKRRNMLGALSFEVFSQKQNEVTLSALEILEGLEDGHDTALNMPSNSKAVGNAGKIPKKVFISYSHKDETWKNDLLMHCSNMVRQGLIEIWQDREIKPGDNWDEEIKSALAESDVVIFMISPALMASRYIWETELPTAIFQRKNGKSKVVPVFVKPVEDKDSPFSQIQGLPRDKKPLSQFSDPDEGLYQVAVELRKMLENW